MYSEDSFHTLSLGGQIGLVTLSAILAAILAFASWRLTLNRRIAIRIGSALTLFLLFVWLSPQIYYFYYLILFDGLPFQSVLKPPPSPITLLELLTFQEDTTLSAHGLGLFGWCLILSALLRGRARLRWPARRD